MSLAPEFKRPVLMDSHQEPGSAETLSSAAIQQELDAIGAVLGQLAQPGASRDAVLRLIAEKSAEITVASGSAIVLREAGEFVCRAAHGESAPLGSRLDTSSGLTAECVRSGSPVRCDDSETDCRVNAASCRELNVRSMAAVPLVCGDQVVGLLEVSSSRPQAFADRDLATLQRLANAAVAAVKHQVAEGDGASEDGNIFVAGNESPEERPAAASWRPALLAVLLLALAASGAAWWRWGRPAWSEMGRARQSEVSRRAPDSALAAQLQIAAAAGDANSQFVLGSLYVRGQGVPEDYQEAAKWFALAAQQGNVPAQSMLGTLYFAGRGVPQDYVSAFMWTKLAADAGNEVSAARLPLLTGLLSPDRLSDAERRVAEWRKLHPASAPSQKQLSPP